MPTSKGRILFSEDDADTRELVSFTLGHEGYEVVATESAGEALEVAKAQAFDLILIDNRMPDMSGPQLCEAIRAFNQQTPILFYSGAGYAADKEAARLAGAQGYLVKPVDGDHLAAEVARLIAASKVIKPVRVVIP